MSWQESEWSQFEMFSITWEKLRHGFVVKSFCPQELFGLKVIFVTQMLPDPFVLLPSSALRLFPPSLVDLMLWLICGSWFFITLQCQFLHPYTSKRLSISQKWCQVSCSRLHRLENWFKSYLKDKDCMWSSSGFNSGAHLIQHLHAPIGSDYAHQHITRGL